MDFLETTDCSEYNFVRLVVGVWLLYSFVITASYGGNLSAFLLKPEFSQPINKVEDVVSSGLPWSMVLYGEEIESYLEQSEMPVEQKLWEEGKTVIPYEEFPINEVLLLYSTRR